MDFISCIHRLIKVLAGAARGKKGNKGGRDRVRLLNVDIRRLGIEIQVDMPFQINGGDGEGWNSVVC